MTRPAKRPPDSLLLRIYYAISPLRGDGGEALCLNFSERKDILKFHLSADRQPDHGFRKVLGGIAEAAA